MTKFLVPVMREALHKAWVEVEAADQTAAKQLAVEIASNDDLKKTGLDWDCEDFCIYVAEEEVTPEPAQ